MLHHLCTMKRKNLRKKIVNKTFALTHAVFFPHVLQANQVRTGVDTKLDGTIYNWKPVTTTNLPTETKVTEEINTVVPAREKSVVQSLTTLKSLLGIGGTETPRDRDNLIFDEETSPPTTVGRTTKPTTTTTTTTTTKSTTTRPATTRKQTTRRKTTTAKPTLSEEDERETLEKNLEYLQTLLGLVTQPPKKKTTGITPGTTSRLTTTTTPTTTTRKTTTTTTTPSTTTTPTTTTTTTTTTPTTTTTTTTPTTTTTTTTTTPSTTTRRSTTKQPVRTTTHSDFEDLAFLNRLVRR